MDNFTSFVSSFRNNQYSTTLSLDFFALIMSPPGWPYLVPWLWILSTCWYRNSSQNLVSVLVSAINFALLYLAGSSTFLFEGIINILNVTYTKTSVSSFSLVIPFASKYILSDVYIVILILFGYCLPGTFFHPFSFHLFVSLNTKCVS